MVVAKQQEKSLVFSFLPVKKVGGGESYTLNCAKTISDTGIECDLIAPSTANFNQLRGSDRFESVFDITLFTGGKSSLQTTEESFIEVLTKIPSYRYVWIHQYLASPIVYDLLLATHHKQIILFTNHGFEENYGDFWIRYNKLPNHFFIEVSQYSASRTQKHTSNVSYVYAGAWKNKVDEVSNTLLDKTKQFVSVGRVLPHKAFEVAIDALTKNDSLVIIGPDCEDHYYKKFLETRARGKNVHFAGEVLSGDKDKIISNSLALIANSSSVTYNHRVFEQSELLGLIIIESIINNTLPISSSQPALKELMAVLKLNNLVYKERDYKSLNSKINLVRSLSHNEYGRLLEQAKEIIRQQFLWDNYWLRVQDIFRINNFQEIYGKNEDTICVEHISTSC